MSKTPTECANCGAEIPRGAKACPECGADERTGWRETSVYDDLDLPESAYDDESKASKSVPPAKRVNGIAWYWWMIGIVVVIVFVAKFVV
jgi:RNA polymerase subunit RPABC4/transcription elongation factor Spt4